MSESLYERRNLIAELRLCWDTLVWKLKHPKDVENYRANMLLDDEQMAEAFVRMINSQMPNFHPLDTDDRKVRTDVDHLMTVLTAVGKKFSIYHVEDACVVQLINPLTMRLDEYWVQCWHRRPENGEIIPVTIQLCRMNIARMIAVPD